MDQTKKKTDTVNPITIYHDGSTQQIRLNFLTEKLSQNVKIINLYFIKKRPQKLKIIAKQTMTALSLITTPSPLMQMQWYSYRNIPITIC